MTSEAPDSHLRPSGRFLGLNMMTKAVADCRWNLNTANYILFAAPMSRATAFWILAADAENDPLKYGLEGKDSYYFSVIENTGQVLLAISLNYETKNILEVLLKVEDQEAVPVTQKMSVIVEDCNDNPPVFVNIPYTAEISEMHPVGLINCTVEAIDYDFDQLITPTYTIERVIPNNVASQHLFTILVNGSLNLTGPLNYNSLSSFYQLLVRATDKADTYGVQFHTETYVSLTIKDEPDIDPQFIGAPYTFSILENQLPNAYIGEVSAVDGDKGINDEVWYYINSASVLGLFNLSGSGKIHVSGAIDREALAKNDEQVILEVVAQEKEKNVYGEDATSRTSVTIRILDVNDNKPQFYNCDVEHCDFSDGPTANFFGMIEEHSAVRVPVANLTITTNDPDKDQNGAYNLHLQGKYASCFSVYPSRIINTGQVQILVNDPVALDYEVIHSMDVEIVANDTGNSDCCSFATIFIELIDINDHTPEFLLPSYSLSVYENCADGTYIETIMATDLDSGELGRITYQLLPESIRENFQVQHSSGEITVVNGTLLDRERRSIYYATLQARDGLNATGSTLLEITILDVNDEIPTAIGTYNIFILENIDNVRIQIEAFDSDEPNTNNSRIEFLLLPTDHSDNFTINVATGLITNRTPLDREAIDEMKNGRIVLTVKLYDLGVPSLSSEVNVTINVEDLNDNEPLFRDSEYHFYVNESTSGAFVGSLQVSDHDQTELNNRVSFRISQGGSGNFIIRAHKEGMGLYRGDLSVDPEVELDYERQQNFNLTIEVQDNGFQGVSFTASTTVVVEVLDLNDEPPYVDSSSLADVSLLENRTVGIEYIKTLIAIDPDTVHELEFRALSVECFKNEVDVGSICYDWLWLAPNGTLFASDTEVVDYELCDLVVMLLRVEDKLTLIGDRYSKNVTQRVVIEDINDHAPEFIAIDETFVVVPDIAPFDYPVALVKASDNDSGVNAEITFSIASVFFIHSSGEENPLSNIFSIVTTFEKVYFQGSVRIATSLDVNLKGQYQVTVNAVDHGIPALNSIRVLNIFTIDASYRVSLTFASTADELRENSDLIQSLLAVATKATVHISNIIEDSEKKIISRANPKTTMQLYFVRSDGTALTPQELDSIIRNDLTVLSKLLELGLEVIGGNSDLGNGQKKDEMLFGVIAGLAGALILVLAIFITALLCMRKSHKRKLRAVNASKIAKTLPGMALQGPEFIPGTNKFNSDRANPMLNIDLEPIIDLSFEENSSTSDSVSVISLYGHVLDRKHGDSYTPQDGLETSVVPDSNDVKEPLALAINGRINKAYDNEALSTTDL
ncbi:cadherin-related family member 2 [Pelodytes ibericus]